MTPSGILTCGSIGFAFVCVMMRTPPTRLIRRGCVYARAVSLLSGKIAAAAWWEVSHQWESCVAAAERER